MLRRYVQVTLLLIGMFLATQLVAQNAGGSVIFQEGALDAISDEFESKAQTWYPTLKIYARNLLLMLAGVGVVWNAFQWALKRQDIQDFMRELVIIVLTIGFYLVAIDNVHVWSAALVDSFEQIAIDILPSSNPLMVNGDLQLSPSTVVSMGYDLWQEFRDIDSNWNIAMALMLTIAGVIATILFAGLAAYLLLLKVEGMVVIGAGVIFLGFAGTEWTIETAKNYLRYLLSFAVKLFAVWIIIAIGITLIEELVFRPLAEAKLAMLPQEVYDARLIDSAFFALVVPFVMLVLSFMIPAIFQQIVGGIGSHGNFALNSVLTTTLMTAASVGKSGMQKAGVAGLGGGALGLGMHQAGKAAQGALNPLTATPGANVDAYVRGAMGAGGQGLKAGFAERAQGSWDSFKQPGLNQGSFVHGVGSHFFPDQFSPDQTVKGSGSIGGSGA